MFASMLSFSLQDNQMLSVTKESLRSFRYWMDECVRRREKFQELLYVFIQHINLHEINDLEGILEAAHMIDPTGRLETWTHQTVEHYKQAGIL